MALWAGGGQKLFGECAGSIGVGMREGRVGWVWGDTALSERSLFLAVIRGIASLSLLLLRGTLPSCPCWSKVLNSRNYLPDNCCTEGWSCVLNNCAWMVSTTLLKRRLGPVRREKRHEWLWKEWELNPHTTQAGEEGSQASSLQSCPQECTDSVSVLQPKARHWGTITQSPHQQEDLTGGRMASGLLL